MQILKSSVSAALVVGCLVFLPGFAQAAPNPGPPNEHSNGASHRQVHYVHPPARGPMPVHDDPFPQTRNHPARPVVVKPVRKVVIRNVRVYKDITNYHINVYHTTVNAYYAAHPGVDRGYWANGWYHGYWHDYWIRQPWRWWGGHYGFWLNLAGTDAFVYEYSPGVCWFWNGFAWVPWYNPPYTAYECPY